MLEEESTQKAADANAAIREELSSEIHCEGRVYHYTSMAAFLRIVESRFWWATSCRCLNDKTEFSVATDLLANRIEQLGIEGGSLLRDFLQHSRSQTRDAIYVASFSELSDSLPQWMAYGDQGDGVAVGVDIADFESKADSANLTANIWIKLVYGEAKQQALIDQFVALFSPLFAPFSGVFDKSQNEALPAEFVKIAGHAHAALSLLDVSFKHNGFASEQEVRLIRMGKAGSVARAERAAGKPSTRIHLRETRFGLADYIQFEVGDAPSQLHIGEIRVGPRRKIEQDEPAIWAAIQDTGFSKLKLTSSRIPLR